MKKYLLPILIASLLLSACGKANTDTEVSTDTPETKNPQKLSDPQRIDSLVVPTCDELFADMEKNYQNLSDDELYKAASDILFSDNREQEANECCNKITDESLKEACNR